MKEVYEFRVKEEYADRLFESAEGKKLGIVVKIRKILLSSDDPKFKRIGELNAELKKISDDYFFLGWTVNRSYTLGEIKGAELFLLRINAVFEPAGEECGTQYDESSACKYCKAGARQVSPLFLNWKQIPKNKDIAKTIAGEIVVSRRVVELFQEHKFTGAEFLPVRHRPSSSAESKDWSQLIVKSCATTVTSKTRAGVNPFDEDSEGEYRCPLGDLIGLSRLSEVWINGSTYSGEDVLASRQFVGHRMGLLRPERFIFVSPRLYQAILNENLRGFNFEIAHIE